MAGPSRGTVTSNSTEPGTTSSPELIEVLAYAGFDFVFVDQMQTGVDWGGLANMVRAARGSEMAVIARVENDPWFGGDD